MERESVSWTMHARQEIMEGMFQGTPVAAADLYLRVDWLNRTVAVGTARVGLPRFEHILYSVLQDSEKAPGQTGAGALPSHARLRL